MTKKKTNLSTHHSTVPLLFVYFQQLCLEGHYADFEGFEQVKWTEGNVLFLALPVLEATNAKAQSEDSTLLSLYVSAELLCGPQRLTDHRSVEVRGKNKRI